LYKGRKHNISHLKVFGCKCCKENLGKFDAKDEKYIFIGYSLNSNVYRVYNKRLMTKEEDTREDEHVNTFLKFKFNNFENYPLEKAQRK